MEGKESRLSFLLVEQCTKPKQCNQGSRFLDQTLQNQNVRQMVLTLYQLLKLQQLWRGSSTNIYSTAFDLHQTQTRKWTLLMSMKNLESKWVIFESYCRTYDAAVRVQYASGLFLDDRHGPRTYLQSSTVDRGGIFSGSAPLIPITDNGGTLSYTDGSSPVKYKEMKPSVWNSRMGAFSLLHLFSDDHELFDMDWYLKYEVNSSLMWLKGTRWSGRDAAWKTVHVWLSARVCCKFSIMDAKNGHKHRGQAIWVSGDGTNAGHRDRARNTASPIAGRWDVSSWTAPHTREPSQLSNMLKIKLFDVAALVSRRQLPSLFITVKIISKWDVLKRPDWTFKAIMRSSLP